MAKKKTFKRTDLSHVVKSEKSRSNLPAPNVNQCDALGDEEIKLYASIMKYVFDNSLPIELRLIIDLLLSSGCRISELLGKNGFIVRLNGIIVVEQPKNKQNIYFRSINFNSYLMQYAGKRYFGLSIYSRFQVYRIFKKMGIYAQFEGISKLSVCHLPRHLQGVLTYMSTNSLNEVQKELSHKSIKSSESYVKKIKK